MDAQTPEAGTKKTPEESSMKLLLFVNPYYVLMSTLVFFLS